VFGFRRRDPAARLKRALGDFELPTFPAAVLEALAMARDPEASTAAIGDAVALDPGLSARILTRVNSPAFGLRRRVESVSHAVAMLGRGPVESILVSVGVRRVVPSKSVQGFEPARFWASAGRRAAVAGELAAVLHPRTRVQSVTAALLQDMGLPFLATRGPEGYRPLLAEAGGSPALAPAEREAFGWDHAEVAGWLCEAWHFPEALAEGIAGHHGDLPASSAAVRLVGLLDDDGGLDALVAAADAEFGMDADQVVALVQRAEEAGDRAA